MNRLFSGCFIWAQRKSYGKVLIDSVSFLIYRLQRQSTPKYFRWSVYLSVYYVVSATVQLVLGLPSLAQGVTPSFQVEIYALRTVDSGRLLRRTVRNLIIFENKNPARHIVLGDAASLIRFETLYVRILFVLA